MANSGSPAPAERGAGQNDQAFPKYSDLIDVPQLQALMESLARVTGVANAMIGVDGTVIAKAGGQQACNEFHRQNPETCARCLESDTALAESMTQGRPYAVYSCLNGLTDTASPIIVNGEHVANIFAGQFLTGPPDLEFFRRQARNEGFDEEKYLSAIAQLPIIPADRIQAITALFVQLASLFASVGVDRIRQRESSDDLRRLNAELEKRVAERARELANSEARQRTVLEVSPVPLALYDQQGSVLYLNPAFTRTFGYTREDLPTLAEWWPRAFPDASYREQIMNQWQERIDTPRQERERLPAAETTIRCKDGSTRTVMASTATAGDGGPDAIHLSVLVDLTGQLSANAAIAQQKEYLEAIFAAEPECLTVVSAQGVLEDINPAGLKTLEVTSLDEAREKTLLEFIDPQFREAYLNLQQRVFDGKTGVLEFSLTGAKGGNRWLEIHAVPLHDEKNTVVSLLGITRDVTDRKAAEDAFRQMAFYDRLTNLPNRRLLEDRLRQLIARSRRSSLRMSLLFIDLDKFKPINDELGHATGDWLLQRVAERMRRCLRESDTVARIGGDEFVVLLPDAKNARNAVRVAEKIRATLELPFITTDGIKLTISSSIGAVLYPDHADNPRDLLRLGDETMYRAKKLGRNAVELYGPTDDDEELADEEAEAAESQSIIQLSWKPAYACGEPAIDQEHKELLQIANTLLDRLAVSGPNPLEVIAIFDAFIEDLSLHCAHEEDILRTHHYREVEAHIAEHRKMVGHALELRRLCAASESAFDKLVDFLTSEVVLGHLLGEDRKYYGLFAEMRRSGGS
jgi:diguanylate cyclase (GGDEF)-like protein/hemerythrin-like metal-binding protein/PAS domain S-box-containing protein